jgi:predicted short-subunit dehydrogenase-like oxidoreductase (DUF2520 family)
MGRLGASLAAALQRTGLTVTTTADTTSRDIVGSSKLIFLSVPDGAVPEVASAHAWRPGQWVVHCSGAMGRDQLRPAEAIGAVTGSFHPLQTFPSRAPEPGRFQNIAIGVEAPEPLGVELERIATGVGGRPFRLEGVDRSLYHAAAVVASNHVIALAGAAARLWKLAGLPEREGREALAPLITSAAANVASMELAEALTGPVARGDVETVSRHLAALETTPELHELYRRLSLQLLELPLALDQSRRSQLGALLTQD